MITERNAMSPEFLQKWEHLLEDIDKRTVPMEFVKKLILKLKNRRQKTLNVERLFNSGMDFDEIEEELTLKLMEHEDSIIGIEFILDVELIAGVVQPETDRLLNGL